MFSQNWRYQNLPETNALGFTGAYFFGNLCYMLLNITYLHGIHSSLKGNRVAYKSWIYSALFLWIVLSNATTMILLLIQSTGSYTIEYDDNAKIAICN